MNILAVDDEYFSLELMKSALGEVAAGANLFPCLDVQSALQVAKETRIDVAFLDIHMPEMTGVELARELKGINPKVNKPTVRFLHTWRRKLIVFITTMDHDQHIISFTSSLNNLIVNINVFKRCRTCMNSRRN